VPQQSSEKPQRRFSLTRAYSIVSVLGIALFGLFVGAYYRHVAVETLIQQETRANRALARSFANNIWPRYAEFLAQARSMPAETLQTRPEIDTLRADVAELMRGLDVVRVKIFSQEGRLVFSTERAEIGTFASHNPRFLQARSGELASELTFRDEIFDLAQISGDRHLISSYIPIRAPGDERVGGVFELYSDVTELVAQIDHMGYTLLFGTSVSLLTLYLVLLAFVRHADNRIKALESAERREHAERIHFLARRDALTGLPNRQVFLADLDRAIGRSARYDRLLAMLYIDLDRFKAINDSLGHDAGDQVLCEMANRVQHHRFQTGALYRIGGDEFAVILEDVTSPEQAGEKAERILEACRQPVIVDGRDVVITASIGIALFPGDTQNPARLVQDAHAASNRAKKIGQDRFLFYSERFNAAALQRLEWESDLRKAVQRHAFQVHLQPRIGVSSGKAVAMEALLRWEHPKHGKVAPNRFVHILEETGLIGTVSDWLIAEACRQCQILQERGYPGMRVSVNVSSLQFLSQSLMHAVRRALAESGLGAEFLELEITESVLVDDPQEAAACLTQLKGIGVQLAIDDFGTGYSSLNYLKHLPVDSLKIDRSFIVGIPENADHVALTETIVTLAQNFGLHSVAEGVETESQYAFLKELGCDEVQGYLFGRPEPLEDLLEHLGGTAPASLNPSRAAADPAARA